MYAGTSIEWTLKCNINVLTSPWTFSFIYQRTLGGGEGGEDVYECDDRGVSVFFKLCSNNERKWLLDAISLWYLFINFFFVNFKNHNILSFSLLFFIVNLCYNVVSRLCAVKCLIYGFIKNNKKKLKIYRYENVKCVEWICLRFWMS